MDENFVAELRVGEFIGESKQPFTVGLRRLKSGRFGDGLNLRGRIIALSLFEGFGSPKSFIELTALDNNFVSMSRTNDAIDNSITFDCDAIVSFVWAFMSEYSPLSLMTVVRRLTLLPAFMD